MRCFQREIELSPRAVEARINLAILINDSNPTEAGKHLREAVHIAPDNPQAQYNLGAYLLLHDDPAGAIGPLEAALRLNPQHPRAATELERARKLAGGE